MLMLISLVLLYVSQLVYTINRWFGMSITLLEDARQARVRRAIDWTMPTPRRG